VVRVAGSMIGMEAGAFMSRTVVMDRRSDSVLPALEITGDGVVAEGTESSSVIRGRT